MRAIASVIILMKEESCGLRDVLAAVFAQEYKDIEVMLLSSLPIPELPQEYPLEVIRAAKNFPGKALNQAFARAKGDYLVVLDARALPRNPRWLHSLLGHFLDKEVAAVGGWGCDPERISFPQTSYRLDLAGFLADPELGLSNVCCAYRREVWERHPFRDSLKQCEDKEWAFRVLKEGQVVVMEYAATVYYIPPEAPPGEAAFRQYWEKNKAFSSFLNRNALDPWEYGKKVFGQAWRKRDPSLLRRGVRAYRLSRRLNYEMGDLASICKARVRFFKGLDFLQHP
ncbi:MAG TPA: hypothetical protein DD435_16255 [Cyanobacteria bacterium UBA8530]|nr:hypothetical protein [Cyanobacteria bacterium UBA8530]